ncbi:MAG TPA: aminopeptidase P N-terminal domain-containing protein [Thermosynechococcus sp. M98_K2018_005]|uniref:aminopeptidase P N-terminal domain-containing protein n=1 Tax=Thermosynechococcus sp. M98_K2018_005 TaxID=2747811 RepID=UPI0019FFB649|nr:aminopeptidase P N-terminal domain-containing protein [Thermosynechococcus sp. M98_K2018_005]HIK34153.1 aminopeptidase P N-terminal domain-containing protein [Thermosynechococcus sp. M98_K2018_005]
MNAEYRQRQQQFLTKLGTGVAVFCSAPRAIMHNDVDYNFRQESNFYYLTGFNEPEAVAVFAPNHSEHRYVLFVQPKDLSQEIWTGARLGVEAAKEQLGADAVYPIGELEQHLPRYLETGDPLYYHFGHNERFNQVIFKHYQRLLTTLPKRGTGPRAIADPSILLAPMRQIKSAAELALMRQAIAITVEAHQRAREVAAPGRWEYEIQAEIEYLFRLRGGDGPAYPPIVASGPNACVLHYTKNQRQMAAGDLLLIDAGCAYRYYNADITRTFPVSGQFSREQQAIYDIVLAAQKAAIEQVQPGNTYNQIHDAAVRVIVEGLVDLGLLRGAIDDLINEGKENNTQKYRTFFMHGTGHWLGLDVHDVGLYKHNQETWVTLQPGQVLTVEPGIYIHPEATPAEGQPEIGDRWRGIGVRIEDDVLVTPEGHEVLTAAVPK